MRSVSTISSVACQNGVHEAGSRNAGKIAYVAPFDLTRALRKQAAASGAFAPDRCGKFHSRNAGVSLESLAGRTSPNPKPFANHCIPRLTLRAFFLRSRTQRKGIVRYGGHATTDERGACGLAAPGSAHAFYGQHSGNVLCSSFHKGSMAVHIPPERLVLEHSSMLGTNAAFVQCPDGTLCWCVILISNQGNEYHVLITYPDGFPYERPLAYVVAPELPPHAPHRYINPEGALCLFPNSFDPSLGCTAGTIRARAGLWIDCFESWLLTGKWKEPEVQH